MTVYMKKQTPQSCPRWLILGSRVLITLISYYREALCVWVEEGQLGQDGWHGTTDGPPSPTRTLHGGDAQVRRSSIWRETVPKYLEGLIMFIRKRVSQKSTFLLLQVKGNVDFNTNQFGSLLRVPFQEHDDVHSTEY